MMVQLTKIIPQTSDGRFWNFYTRFDLKTNLDFELRAIFTAYKGLKWRMRAMVSTACVTSINVSTSVIHMRASLQSNTAA